MAVVVEQVFVALRKWLVHRPLVLVHGCYASADHRFTSGCKDGENCGNGQGACLPFAHRDLRDLAPSLANHCEISMLANIRDRLGVVNGTWVRNVRSLAYSEGEI